MNRLLGCVALGAAIVVLPNVRADAPKKAITDAEFVQIASASGLAEVNISKAAMQRATRDDVKSFARQMVQDHTKANMELNRLADSKRLTPAATMDAKHQDLSRQMLRLSGEEFDRQYVQSQLKDHQQAVALFENESKNGKDEDLKAFATKTLPTLREHLEMVRKLSGNRSSDQKDNLDRNK